MKKWLVIQDEREKTAFEELVTKDDYEQIRKIYGIDYLYDLAKWFHFIGYSTGLKGIILSIERDIRQFDDPSEIL